MNWRIKKDAKRIEPTEHDQAEQIVGQIEFEQNQIRRDHR